MAPAITVHFHPGWPFGDGTVLEALAAAGVYRTQWETGTSVADSPRIPVGSLVVGEPDVRGSLRRGCPG